MIKKYLEFNESVKVKEEIPEITSLDSPVFNTSTFNKIKRELTDNELRLLDEYVSKFEKVFLLKEEDIRNILLDIDLIDSSLKIKIQRFLILDKDHVVDFDARNEINDINSFITLKRYYDNYTNKLVTPIDTITIKRESDYNKSFDNIKVYEYIEMIKGTLEDMCNCKLELKEGGPYQIQFRIKYPKTFIVKYLRKFNEENKYNRSVAMIHDYFVENLAYLIDLNFKIEVNFREIRITLGEPNRWGIRDNFYWDDIKYDIIPVIEQLYKDGNIKDEVLVKPLYNSNLTHYLSIDDIINDNVDNNSINLLIIPLK